MSCSKEGIPRRQLLTSFLFLTGKKITEQILPWRIPDQPSFVSVQEIMQRYPQINRFITAVNLSLLPQTVEGGLILHNNENESFFIAIPYRKSEKNFFRETIYQNLQKQVQTYQKPTFLILELPCPTDVDFDSQCQQWKTKISERAKFFQSETTNFIIGNEINAQNTLWADKLDLYLDLYLQSYEIIKKFNPKMRVFPWQEAYFQHGELLETFLQKLRQQNGTIDGLPINFYDVCSKMEARILEYHCLLEKNSFLETPIVISELSKPENYQPSEREKASFVIQHLVTAAYWQQKGLIERAAWFAAWAPQGYKQDCALSTSLKDNRFVAYPSLNAFLLSSHLLNGEINLKKDSSGLVMAEISQKGSPKTSFFWNEGSQSIILKNTSQNCQLLTPTGGIIPRNCPLTLEPAKNPVHGAGDSAILV